MNNQSKSKEELMSELQELLHESDSLKALIEKREAEFLIANKELVFQNSEKEERVAELIIANKELAFQNEEKEKRAAEYKNIYDNAIEGMFRTSLEGKIMQSNKALAKMLGYDTANDVVNSVNDSGSQVWANADERLKYAKLLEEQDIIRKFECQYKRVDGGIIWVSLNSRLVRDENGKALYYEGFVEEITEQKRAEEMLRASDALLQSAISIMPVGLWVFNAEGKIVISSAAAQQIWEGVRYVGVDQLGEYKGWRTDNGKLIEAHEWAGARALEKGETSIEEKVEIECFDGTHKIILDTAVPLFKSDGSIDGAITINQDITERKRAEEMLRESKVKYQEIFESTGTATFIGDENGICLMANNECYSITGYTPTEIIGQNWNQYFAPESFQEMLKYHKLRRENPDLAPKRYEVKLINKQGELRDAILNVAMISGTKQSVISVIDITGRKQAEELLKITLENLERSNKELEQFAYVASHDLQEPLRMVASYTQLLERRYKDKLDQDANDFIHYAVDGANRMQKLINDLLDYSRTTSRGKDFTKVDTSQVLGQTISNLQQLIIENNALITNEDLPELKADESQIMRVFQNLIVNAIKFKKKSEIPKIHISCKKKNEFYEFAVRDNGIGIEMQYHDRVFTIFQRLHSIKDYPGTGIGLSICKRIVERHGGKIWFESKENEGTTFYFTLKK